MDIVDDMIPKRLEAHFVKLFVQVDVLALLVGSWNLVLIRRWIDGLKLKVIE